jgi:hypothetical protein
MEQYRRYDPVKKKYVRIIAFLKVLLIISLSLRNKSFGANFVRRARQMLGTDARVHYYCDTIELDM